MCYSWENTHAECIGAMTSMPVTKKYKLTNEDFPTDLSKLERKLNIGLKELNKNKNKN